MIQKYFVAAFNQNSGQGGTSFPQSNEDHGKKPHQHGELVAGDIKIFTYDELIMATRNFNNDTRFVMGSNVKGWIDETGYSPCVDGTGLPIFVKTVRSHILSDPKMLKKFRHPNLVKVIGYYKGKTNLLVTEFVHNGNFKNLLRTGTIGLLPLATKVKIAVGIARGIVYLSKVSYLSPCIELWGERFCNFEFDTYKILLDEDFTAKLSEYDITNLVEDYGFHIYNSDLNYKKTGLVDGDYYPGSSPPEEYIPIQAKILFSFRSVFTEVLTGRDFCIEELHKINSSLSAKGKPSLDFVANFCYQNCNGIDSEQMMLKYFEEYENHVSKRLVKASQNPRKGVRRDVHATL